MNSIFKISLFTTILSLLMPVELIAASSSPSKKIEELLDFSSYCISKSYSAFGKNPFSRFIDTSGTFELPHWTDQILSLTEECEKIFADNPSDKNFSLDTFNEAFEYVGGLSLLLERPEWSGRKTNYILIRPVVPTLLFSNFKPDFFGKFRSEAFKKSFDKKELKLNEIPAYKALFYACKDYNLEPNYDFLIKALKEIEAKKRFLRFATPAPGTNVPTIYLDELEKLIGHEGIKEACKVAGSLITENLENFINDLILKIKNTPQSKIQCFDFFNSLHMAYLNFIPNNGTKLFSFNKRRNFNDETKIIQKYSERKNKRDKILIFSNYSMLKNSNPVVETKLARLQNKFDYECQQYFISNLTINYMKLTKLKTSLVHRNNDSVKAARDSQLIISK